MSLSRKAIQIAGLLGVTFLVAATAAPAQEAPLKIAIVDLERVVTQSAQGQALQKKLEQFKAETQALLDARAAEGQALRKQITDGANSLSETRLGELQKQMEDLQITIRRLQDDKQREGQKMQNDGLRQIEIAIEPVIRQLRDEHDLDLILNNVPGVVVMAGPRLDITQEVVDRLAAAGE
jgi:outer membrane protein